MQVLFDIPNFSCIMQLRAENQNLVSALSNYQQILYQFFDFTQNLKQSRSKYWLSVLNSLKNRGVQDILILCSDGLTGIKDAISTAFPKTEQQRCIVHMLKI